MVEVPEGYRIERREDRPSFTTGEIEEVEFTVIDTTDDDRRVTATRARLYPGADWGVAPGSMVWHMPAREARARAAAFLMVAEECERRNDAG